SAAICPELARRVESVLFEEGHVFCEDHDAAWGYAGGAMKDKVRSVLRQHARLGTDIDKLGDEGDLYEAGMTSHASVNVMLALEGEFDIEFPDHMLKRNVFNTIASIHAALDELTA